MKTLNLPVVLALLAAVSATAQTATPPVNPPGTPPPIYQQQPAPAVPPAPVPRPAPYVYEPQKTMVDRPALMSQEQARTIIDHFKAAYPKLGSPRLLIYVNRQLVGDGSGLKVTSRTEHIESQRTLGTDGVSNTAGTVKMDSKSIYAANDKGVPTLADRQTVRDVERLFGHPLRAAGASLADQSVAAQLISDKSLSDVLGTSDTPEARKDREALRQVADAVIEVLISSKTIPVATLTGNAVAAVPDIQATVINLKDARILGQASSADVTGHIPPGVLATYDVSEITEATALALMDDMAPR